MAKKSAKSSGSLPTEPTSTSKSAKRVRGNAKNKTRKYVPWAFPKNSLEEAIKLAQAIEEKNAGKPLDSENVAKYLGFSGPDNLRFGDLLRSANQYGLVTGTGTKVKIGVEKIGEEIVSPSSSEQRQNALREAFNKVDLFKQVTEFYRNKRIPEDEYFANTLVREFDVPRDRVEQFIKVFTENLQYLKAFSTSPEGGQVVAGVAAQSGEPQRTQENGSCQDATAIPTRQFLDTCFVLMPFGDWYDRYYEEIYKLAIKDAGYEPVRADNLFHSGSVMEQIWEQVCKAKVLLAELTGKNANVFYELGLSHARAKPVVIVTGELDDVPFDLRHLRVITYDVREPSWAARLRKDIAVYLRNTRNDPAKSIPQPFRDSTGYDGQINDEVG